MRGTLNPMLLDIVDHVASSLWRGRANRKDARERDALRARGVLAPAVVVEATTRGGRSNVDGEFIKITYTVDVLPAGVEPFRARFVHWSERRGYTAVMGHLQGEVGRQIWVTYDPAAPEDMIFEYDEPERLRRLHEAELDARRAAFNAVAEPLEALKSTGVPAVAMIVHALDAQLPYPARACTVIELHLDVTPPDGPVYRAVVPALIGVGALAKYSAGRQVFVRFDPHAPLRVVLDTERNRDLPV